MERVKTNRDLFIVLTEIAQKSELPLYNSILPNLVINLN